MAKRNHRFVPIKFNKRTALPWHYCPKCGLVLLKNEVSTRAAKKECDLIVITDEQSQDRVPDPVAKHAYMINVASYKNGVGYGRWVHLDGFSERVLSWIAEYERG